MRAEKLSDAAILAFKNSYLALVSKISGNTSKPLQQMLVFSPPHVWNIILSINIFHKVCMNSFPVPPATLLRLTSSLPQGSLTWRRILMSKSTLTSSRYSKQQIERNVRYPFRKSSSVRSHDCICPMFGSIYEAGTPRLSVVLSHFVAGSLVFPSHEN